MLADHNAFIDFDAGSHEEHSTTLHAIKGIRCGRAVAVGDESSAGPLRDLALVWHVTVKERIHYDGAAGFGQHFTAQTDQAAAGNTELQTHTAVAVVVHLKHLAASRSKTLNHGPDKGVGYVDGEVFHGFQYFAIVGFGNDLGPAHHKLKAFATHHFDQDGKLKLSAAENLEAVGAAGFFDADGDVGE